MDEAQVAFTDLGLEFSNFLTGVCVQKEHFVAGRALRLTWTDQMFAEVGKPRVRGSRKCVLYISQCSRILLAARCPDVGSRTSFVRSKSVTSLGTKRVGGRRH